MEVRLLVVSHLHFSSFYIVHHKISDVDSAFSVAKMESCVIENSVFMTSLRRTRNDLELQRFFSASTSVGDSVAVDDVLNRCTFDAKLDHSLACVSRYNLHCFPQIFRGYFQRFIGKKEFFMSTNQFQEVIDWYLLLSCIDFQVFRLWNRQKLFRIGTKPQIHEEFTERKVVHYLYRAETSSLAEIRHQIINEVVGYRAFQ
ncbi:hypothetical protein PENTCL1PPCAC_13276 [Pristionchus entomophagus]|uniref:Uncharacterized protein n=1 Tax=Pristionchus entomophagus TaxID=358040 RepID=A0AAV5TFP0_9BILA|nr:hypothetical protein PENTCL1PPCAC_13276 [Pristionchus entomophagus]